MEGMRPFSVIGLLAVGALANVERSIDGRVDQLADQLVHSISRRARETFPIALDVSMDNATGGKTSHAATSSARLAAEDIARHRAHGRTFSSARLRSSPGSPWGSSSAYSRGTLSALPPKAEEPFLKEVPFAIPKKPKGVFKPVEDEVKNKEFERIKEEAGWATARMKNNKVEMYLPWLKTTTLSPWEVEDTNEDGGILSLSRRNVLNDLQQDVSDLRQPITGSLNASADFQLDIWSDTLNRGALQKQGREARGSQEARQIERFKRTKQFTGVNAGIDGIFKKNVTEMNATSASKNVSSRYASTYDEIKDDLLLETSLAGLVGTALTFSLYGQGPGISFAVGTIASILYVRLLARSTDAMAAEDMGAALGGLAGPPRLLIPILIVGVINKNHDRIAAQYGVDLSVVAFLAGFFVYKGAQGVELAKSLLPNNNDK